MAQSASATDVTLSALSALLLIGTLLILPWLLTRIPPDYFATSSRKHSRFAQKHPKLRLDWLILRNLAGSFLVLAGLLMLFMPGQRILTILTGLLLMNWQIPSGTLADQAPCPP